MTAAVLALSNPTCLGRYFSPGVSDEAHSLDRWSRSSGDSTVLPATQEIRKSSLDDIYTECAQQDWDGYGAKAVSVETYLRALMFLETLPAKFSRPEVSAHPDGDISFDWYVSKLWSMDVSISANGRIHYAAFLGEKRRKGSDVFRYSIPSEILNILGQLHSGNAQ